MMERWLMHPRFLETMRFVERGFLLTMGSVAFGAWALMFMRFFSDFHPIFELATHTSLHVFAGCFLVLVLEILFFLVRRKSSHAGPRWKRRLAFTLIPLVFFAWVTTPWRMLPLKKAQQEPGAIKILSWNMLLVNRNYEDALALVQREQPDILLLIELSPLASKQLEPLRAMYPYSHCLPAWEGCGIGMMSRIPHTDFRTLYLANHWMPAIELQVERTDGKGTLSLLGVHTVSPHLEDERRTNFRNQQLNDLGRWATDQPGGAMIIGDLNVTPWSPPFWRLLQEGRLSDSSWYRGYFSSWPTILQRVGIPIDHALVNEKIKVLDRRNIYGRSNSDHFPIVITIQ